MKNETVQMMNDGKTVDTARRAREAFDGITGASFYGFHFREVLRENPKALEAAETLVEALKEANIKGLREAGVED